MLTPPSPPRRRRWLRLSLRTLMALIVLVALGLGWWVNAVQTQRAAVAAILAVSPDAAIQYDDLDFAQAELTGNGETHPRWLPEAVDRWLGHDFFNTVSTVHVLVRDDPSGIRTRTVMRAVAKLRHLKGLTVEMPVDDADIELIAGHHQLQEVLLLKDCPDLTDESLRVLARLPRLQSLGIADAPVTDAGLAALGRLDSLESLHLGNIDGWLTRGGQRVMITGTGLAALARLPHLHELEIDAPTLTGAGLRELGLLVHLDTLRIAGGSYGDADLQGLAPLVHLETLKVAGSRLDGTGFRWLAGLTQLKRLDLVGPTTAAAMPALARLPALEQLELIGHRLTLADLVPLRAAQRLNYLSVDPAVADTLEAVIRVVPGCTVANGNRPGFR